MKVSYNWLKEYISLAGVTPDELASKLTNAGLEVEDMYTQASGTNLVIGEVIECEKHPDADHLNVCKVDIKSEVLDIVCGAPNVRKGIKVIVARVNAKLPEITIKASKIRGVSSNGMLCSLAELGVDKHNLRPEQINGIEELPSDAEVGNTEVLKYLGLDDVILDIGLTPNRKDCLAMFNLAKEVGAVLKRPVTLPEYQGASKIGKPSTFKVHSKTANCPIFLGKVVNKVEIKPSPKWMVNYLNAAGIKAINNVVDISNFVMLETGQPLHFYDLNKLATPEITVVDDLALTMTALDEEEYAITKGDLLITNNSEPIGIAGIMGGDASKIDEHTTAIFIEAAEFDHVAIRTTSRRLGLNTEACARFTKGLEPLAQIKAMDRSVALLKELADADDFEENVLFGEINYQPIKVKENLTHLNTFLGMNFKKEDVLETLTYLDFKPEFNGDEFVTTIPSYRTDVTMNQDLDEELIRLNGFDSLKATLPKMQATVGQLTKKQLSRRTIRNFLTGQGCSEVVTYSLVSDHYIENGLMEFGAPIVLSKPLSEERKYIRNSLMYSLLECKAYNAARKNANINLFEVSNVYAENQVQERLGILLSDDLQVSVLNKVKIGADFYVLKGIIMNLLAKFGYQGTYISVKPNRSDDKHFNPYASAEIYIGRDLLGIFGNIHPNIAKEFGIKKTVYAELNLETIVKNRAGKVRFKPINIYPSSKRDIALVVNEDVLGADITTEISKCNKLVTSAEIFDIYTGEHVEKRYKAMAISIKYQDNDHTLTDEEISIVHEEILKRLKKKFKAELRG